MPASQAGRRRFDPGRPLQNFQGLTRSTCRPFPFSGKFRDSFQAVNVSHFVVSRSTVEWRARIKSGWSLEWLSLDWIQKATLQRSEVDLKSTPPVVEVRATVDLRK